MNPRKIERVARAICNEARMQHHPDRCPMDGCDAPDGSKCQMWQQFTGEAKAALRAVKGF